ncbi:MAG: preprotein translocase subunit YajC [Planctomycetes bacterium]|nr:preprotein translocase subunit YajC [Planctomycetota bacterium]
MGLQFIGQESAPAKDAPAQGGGQQEAPSMMPLFVLMGAVLLVMWFFSSRSRKRQEAEHKNKIKQLEKGTRVMLTSGLIAKVDKVDEESDEVRVIIDEDKKVYSTYATAAIAKIFDEKRSSVKDDDKTSAKAEVKESSKEASKETAKETAKK